MKKTVYLLCAAVVCILSFGQLSFCQDESAEKPQVLFFFSESCHVCHELKTSFMPGVIERFKDSAAVVYRDMADMETYKQLVALRKEYRQEKAISIPTVFVNGSFLVGKKEIQGRLIPLIERAVRGERVVPVDGRAVDLAQRLRSFTPLAVLGAGLIDGVNPCAFTVIVFFISFLALQGYRKRELALIGLGFILAVFMTYLLIGVGLFEFFYKIQAVWLVRRLINAGVGVLSLILAILAVYDIFVFRKNGQTEGMVLQLPAAVKAQIHRVIGMHYRRSASSAAQPGQQDGPGRTGVAGLIVMAFFTGFLVSLLEAVCTGQVYLPTITFVLKTAPHRWDAVLYLVLYNVMFVIPLVVVFLLALLGVTSGEFARVFRKHLVLSKVVMAFLFLGMGIFLVWRG